jgi:catechol 2,3-dioxygenase-like lactoylglutathione lyase family enzyme
MELDALNHVGLLVSDIDRSIEWYERALGLQRAYEFISGRKPTVLYVHDPDLYLVEITTYEIPPENASVGKKPA